MIRTQLRSGLHKLRGFATDPQGVSAIEFALIAPLMVILYIGGVEVTQGVAMNRKTTLVAHAIADLVSQSSSIDNSESSDVIAAASQVLVPYSDAFLGVTVSSIVIDAAGVPKIAWSDTKNGIVHAPGAVMTLDPALSASGPGTSVILGEATYSYQPTFAHSITGPLTFTDKIYMKPRLSACVLRPPNVTIC
jgi:Flp pilus assembly protein TadG